jgi:hypothetical protein
VPIVDPSKRTTVNVTQATNANSNIHLYSVPIQESHQSMGLTKTLWYSYRRSKQRQYDCIKRQYWFPSSSTTPSGWLLCICAIKNEYINLYVL